MLLAVDGFEFAGDLVLFGFYVGGLIVVGMVWRFEFVCWGGGFGFGGLLAYGGW